MPILDVSDKAAYEEVPALLKVKSDLSVRRAKELVARAFAVDGIEKEQDPGNKNWVRDIQNELRNRKNNN